MHKFTGQELAEALQDCLLQGAPLQGEYAPCTDTRKLAPGDLFVGLRGGDSREVAEKAVAAGAAALLLSVEGDFGVPVLRVPDTVAALQKLGAYQRRRHPVPVIGVTGSCGKTTSKNMLGAVLGTRGRVLVTKGNLNNDIGVPLTLLEFDSSIELGVVEMGMNHSGEIAVLTRLARPDAALITNVGSAHIEYLGSREAIAEAKAEIFRGVPPGGAVALPAESDFFPKLAALAKLRNLTVLSFGQGGDCEFEIESESLEGLTGTLRTPLGAARLLVPVQGRYQAANIAGAAAGALALLPGISLEEIARGLAAVPQEKLRNELRSKNGVRFILDCYNANPDSMQAALQMLGSLPCQGRKIALLGDMLEIGDQGEKAHLKAGRTAGAICDVLLCIGEFAPVLAKGAQGGRARVLTVDEASAAPALEKVLQPGDTVLFKGSRGCRLERYYDEIKDRQNA